MKVFIVMDTTDVEGKESIIGVFKSLEGAKNALVDHVLNSETRTIHSCYVDIAEFEVEE